ncbi:hypothetical protein F511_16523 [Dorcoceras hygrometricum]|uniref:Uncharacterized protein n=1 Tax=Dorcoceras hygrometricum TaxID=472368 RepID=A0A2Z7BKG9_9LAMI|nr:hypothetical protein F511_16523 [Dorcoceras hygrometricum]
MAARCCEFAQHVAQQLAPDGAHPFRAAAGHWQAINSATSCAEQASDRPLLRVGRACDARACAYRSDQIVDRSYDEVTLIGMNPMFIRWTGPAPASRRLAPCALRRRVPPPSAALFVIGLVSITATSLKCRFPRETGRSQVPRRQQGNPGSTAGRGFNPAGGAPGGG